MNYEEYLKTRTHKSVEGGLLPISRKTMLFDFQRPIVDWALKRGKAAIFADTGTGKTAMQTHWADEVFRQTGGSVLMLAPLAVASQTIKEAAKFGIEIGRAEHEEINPRGVVITNYEQLHKFDPSLYIALVLDESSIMKGLNGKVRGQIQAFASDVRYRLSCTATPSPNDFMELGTQCEFLGVMKQSEMLAMYFTHDSARTSKWRLKGHAKDRFFEWMATWAVFLKNPRDIGFNGDAYDLPPMNHYEHVVGVQSLEDKEMNNAGLLDRNRIRKASMQQRCEKVAELVAGMDDQVLIWCNLNGESEMLNSIIEGSVQVTGSDKPDHKEKNLLGFASGDVRVLISKPKIAGFGMNYQGCNKTIFTGLSDSWEQYYQAVRRVYRFGQLRNVDVHIVSHADEGAVVQNIKRKDDDNNELSTRMLAKASAIFAADIGIATYDHTVYEPTQLPEFPLL